MHLTHHKTVGLQYFVTALGFLLVGFLLMLVLRWQLAWPTAPMPALFAAAVGSANAPGGYMAPEFYNQLVAMHGTVMIFLAIVPLLTGAFGNYLVPLQIGAHDMAYPRLNATSYWTYFAAGAVMLASFFVEGGAADSGWTAYPPLSTLATRGQDFWLVGIFLLGVSAMLNSINMIATVVQLRAPGLPFMGLTFFVWAQLVAALLLLLAFPSLQAAGLLQLMDRLVGTSFFLPTGLIVNGSPLQGVSGQGNALLWQHLFWFLGHPEVYVLILPAIGIVSEIIAHHTGRRLWGYRAMVWSVLLLGVTSVMVWAHHMFLTGMGTTLGAFFQVTTMIVSIPSVVLLTALMGSLWGGSIRFTTPMLFALAFLPMFGIGGLTGLPLGLAASDVILHDTWYVVGHFHFLVAPGTLFAIFAGIYYWFPSVTGRTLNHALGLVHFWGSLATMTAIFLPMFTLGLRGVNRRLYDAGMSYAHAQGTLGIQEHMTWAAVALGVFQLPFLANIVASLVRGQPKPQITQITQIDRREHQIDRTEYLIDQTQHQIDPTEHQIDPTERQIDPTEHQIDPTKHRIDQTEHQIDPTEHQIDQTEHQTDQTEHQTDRTDRTAPMDHTYRFDQTRLSGPIPWTYQPRPDSRTTNVRLGIWLFLASEAMFFGSLFSAHVLLRTSAHAWADSGDWLSLPPLLVMTSLLLLTSAVTQRTIWISTAAGLAFLALKGFELSRMLDASLHPAVNLSLASWFVLTGVHWLHVAGGVGANAWLARSIPGLAAAHRAERFHALRLYWAFVDVIWVAILVAFLV